MTVSGELCCVALPFCCGVVVALPFSASLGVIVHACVISQIHYIMAQDCHSYSLLPLKSTWLLFLLLLMSTRVCFLNSTTCPFTSCSNTINLIINSATYGIGFQLFFALLKSCRHKLGYFFCYRMYKLPEKTPYYHITLSYYIIIMITLSEEQMVRLCTCTFGSTLWVQVCG